MEEEGSSVGEVWVMGVCRGCQKDNIPTKAQEQVGLHTDALPEPGSVTEPIKQLVEQVEQQHGEEIELPRATNLK